MFRHKDQDLAHRAERAVLRRYAGRQRVPSSSIAVSATRILRQAARNPALDAPGQRAGRDRAPHWVIRVKAPCVPKVVPVPARKGHRPRSRSGRPTSTEPGFEAIATWVFERRRRSPGSRCNHRDRRRLLQRNLDLRHRADRRALHPDRPPGNPAQRGGLPGPLHADEHEAQHDLGDLPDDLDHRDPGPGHPGGERGRRICTRSLASRLDSGSSNRKAAGLMATRWRWPPESCRGLRSSSLVGELQKISAASRTRCSISALGRRRGSSGRRPCCRTPSCAGRARSSGTPWRCRARPAPGR